MSMSMHDFIGGGDLSFYFWCIVLLSYFLAINHCNHSATHWWKEKNTKCEKETVVWIAETSVTEIKLPSRLRTDAFLL